MATEAKKPLKGILKKSRTTPATPSTVTAAITSTRTSTTNNNQPDPRAIAVYHARLLEDRKAAEAAVFDNIVALLDYPLHPSLPPASSPHPSDAEAFLSLVRPLQPSDYDDLVVERNLSDGGRCGYALCPRPRRRFPGAGTYKMVNKGRKDFDIVETRELERWCSAECARRALWVKVQLSETAAWERAGLPELRIELYPEKDAPAAGAAGGGDVGKDKEKELEAASAQQQQQGGSATSDADLEGLASVMDKVQLGEDRDRKVTVDTAALALERGDDVSGLPIRSVDVVIREKTVTTRMEAPSLGDPATEDAIEGYRAKFRAGAEQPKIGNESDEDSDWGI